MPKLDKEAYETKSKNALKAIASSKTTSSTPSIVFNGDHVTITAINLNASSNKNMESEYLKRENELLKQIITAKDETINQLKDQIQVLKSNTLPNTPS